MRRLLATAVAASSLAVLPAAPVALADRNGPIASAACTRAKIEGQTKCIARGQFCKRSARAMRDYARHGLRCTERDVNGRYHLQ
jgi:hypothetical protein